MDGYSKYIGNVFGGRYKIIREVNEGGMAVVFEATDIVMNRTVAVKMLKEEIKNDESSVKRFISESKAVSMLSHKNIVTIYDVSIVGSEKYIVMEFINGITLKSHLNHYKTLPFGEVVNFSEQILSALEHAHSKKIYHRDIKPQNIMLLRSGQIKVTDFGIAKLPNAETLTMSDKAIGTVFYISPEQASGKEVDCRTDLYSLGVLMYEMATGVLPFWSDNAITVAMKQVSEKPAPPSSKNPNIPKGLEQIILCALEKNPDCRFRSASEMLHRLRQLEANPNLIFATAEGSNRIIGVTVPAGNDPQTNTQNLRPVQSKSNTGTNVKVTTYTMSGINTANTRTQPSQNTQTGSTKQPRTNTGNQQTVKPNTGSNTAVKPVTGRQNAVKPVTGRQNAVKPNTGSNTAVRVASGTKPTTPAASGTYRSNYADGQKQKKPQQVKTKPKRGNHSMFPVIAGVTLAFIIVLAASGIYMVKKFMSNSAANDPKTISVDNYIGKTYDDEFIAKLKKLNYYDLEVVEVYEDDAERNKIIDQEPTYGEKRKVIPGVQKCQLKLTVSRGVQTFTLPDYSISDARLAEAELRNRYGLVVVRREEYHDTIRNGYVIATEPAPGEELKSGDTVVLVVSIGQNIDYITVPDFVGMTEDKAYQSLVASTLLLGDVTYVYTGTDEYPTPVDPGRVIRQSRTAKSSVPANSTRVSFVVSLGVEPEETAETDGTETDAEN